MSFLISSSLAPASNASANDCLGQQVGEPVQILRVIDGDTVILDDERRVRLIGLNTLELNTSDPQDKAMANKAKQALQRLLAHGQATLILGIQPHDQHGRLLGHLRLPDGRDIAQSLLKHGLALAVTVGGNNQCASVLQALEQSARKKRLGLWEKPGSWLVKGRLTGHEHGFHLVTGQVISTKVRTLILNNGLEVRFGKHWPSNTTPLSPAELLGKHIRVRGWLSRTAGRTSLTLHHPSNLEMVTN